MASIKTNVAYSVILNVTKILFPFITAPYAARVLGVENIGIASFATTYTAYFVMLAMLGIPTYGMRAIAKCKDSLSHEKTFTELFSIVAICTLLVTAIYIASIYFVPTLYEQRLYLLLMGISLYLTPLNIDWYFSGKENFRLITIRTIIIKILMIAALFIFVRDRDDLAAYILLNVGVLTLNHIWNWVYLFKYEISGLRFKGLNLRMHIKPTLLLFASIIAISIYTMLDTLMLGFISSYEEVGYYSSAIKMCKIAVTFVTASSAVVFVKIAALKEQNDFSEMKRVLEQSFSFMYTFAVPITIGLIVIAPRFVPFFYGSEFALSILPMQILSLLILVIGLNNIYGPQILQSTGCDKQFVMAVLFGTVSNFGLNLLLIPKLGATGASVASVIAEIIVTIAVLLFSLKVVKLTYSIKTLLQPIVSSMPFIGVYMILNKVNLTDFEYLSILITSCGFVYFIMMYFLIKNDIVVNIINDVLRKFSHK